MPQRGKVKWFDPKKGFGFLVGPEGQDVFVHYTHIMAEGFRTLKDGEDVDYELTEGDKGYQARDVHRVDDTSEGGESEEQSEESDQSESTNHSEEESVI